MIIQVIDHILNILTANLLILKRTSDIGEELAKLGSHHIQLLSQLINKLPSSDLQPRLLNLLSDSLSPFMTIAITKALSPDLALQLFQFHLDSFAAFALRADIRKGIQIKDSDRLLHQLVDMYLERRPGVKITKFLDLVSNKCKCFSRLTICLNAS